MFLTLLGKREGDLEAIVDSSSSYTLEKEITLFGEIACVAREQRTERERQGASSTRPAERLDRGDGKCQSDRNQLTEGRFLVW